MTREEFIEKANEVYNFKYNYDNVPNEDLAPARNVPITCPKHGLFFQSVYNHLCGEGCFECYKEEHWNKK